MKKLNVANIDKARPGDVLRDSEIRGLCLRVFETKAVYYLRYRTRQGVERRPRIADASILSLPAARAKAKEWLAVVAAGSDPAAAFQRATGKTLADLRDRYMEAHAKPKKKKKSAHNDRLMWAQILADLGEGTLVSDVTRGTIATFHQKRRSTPVHANRMLSLLTKAFNLTESWEWRPEHSNPCRLVERYPEKKRKRVPTIAEAIALMNAMDDSRAGDPYFVGLIEILCYTGARRMEIQGARRAWVTDRGLELPDSKGGERVLPLNEHARFAINRLPPMLGNPYLIPGSKPKRHLVDAKKPWYALCKRAEIVAGRKNGGLTMHDLRRFFASAGLSAKLTLEQVGELLGHREFQTTKGYAFLLTDAAALAATAAGDAVSERLRANTGGR